ncbi:hypothetical protein [Aquibium oceanicum]|uniref:hypothetical protein n=1 Tax=Aquibium oceanicum TaxID=1670800 RepID=UPI001F1A2B74|nr:hypothetical protein [Aquibium oceanicum]
MVDGGAQILERAARGRLRGLGGGEVAAEFAVHLAHPPLAEEGQHPDHAGGRLLRLGVAGHDVGQVDVDDVGDQDPVGVASALARRPVLFADEFGEPLLSAFAVASAAASADEGRSVADEPSGRVAQAPVGLAGFVAPDEACPFRRPRHFSLISSIAASVTYSLPATSSVTSRPASRSLRRPLAPMEPSGKAILAAMSSRSGVACV